MGEQHYFFTTVLRPLFLSMACILLLTSGLVRPVSQMPEIGAKRIMVNPSRKKIGIETLINQQNRLQFGAGHSPMLPGLPDEALHFDEDPEGRSEWFLFQRTYPHQTLPIAARRRAWEQRPRRIKLLSLGSEQRWRAIGPFPTASAPPDNWGFTSGRINSVAVSPADDQIVLVGSATGGIWRSTDGGETFAPASDEHIDLAVGSIAFSRSNSQIVYAGMGDTKSGYLGNGVLKSTDSGRTWSRVNNTTLPNGGLIAKIEVDPANPDRVYLAQSLRLSGTSFLQSGFFLSIDGGVNWSLKLTGRVEDMVFDPANSQTLYLGARSRGQSNVPVGVYKSTDGGETWSNIYALPYSTAASVRVAVSPASPGKVYVFTGGFLDGEFDLRVAVSSNGGMSWINIAATDVDFAQLGYNSYLYADPLNANTLYAGTRDLYKSTDEGRSWTNLTGNFTPGPEGRRYTPFGSTTHPDQQAFAFSPADSNVIYAGNDGGLSKSFDGGKTFRSLNQTLSLTQFYSIAVHPTDETIIYGGTQDNGVQRRLGNTYLWNEFQGGDGGNIVVNPLDPNMIFPSYIRTRVFRYKDDGLTFDKEIGGDLAFGKPGSRVAFIAPFTGNGVDSTLYFGTWRLFISTDLGETWSAPAKKLDLTKGKLSPSDTGDVLSVIAVSPSDKSVIYTGSSRGRAMVSSNGGATWTDVTAGLPNRFISSIRVDAANPALAYLTISGFRSGHVFKTTDRGANWVDISGNLPDIPTNALIADRLDPNTLYAGTDLGVFRSTSGGNNWEEFNEGLPLAPVSAFAYSPGGKLRLATYGRGMYELSDDGARQDDFSFLVNNPNQDITTGSATAFTIGVQKLGGFTGPVELNAAFSPASDSMGVSLSSTIIAPGESANVEVRADSNAPQTVFTLNITGTASGITRLLPLRLSIGPPTIQISGIVVQDKKLKLKGFGFGNAPRVLINQIDKSEFIKSASDARIKVKGQASELGLKEGNNTLQVINADGKASNTLTFAH